VRHQLKSYGFDAGPSGLDSHPQDLIHGLTALATSCAPSALSWTT